MQERDEEIGALSASLENKNRNEEVVPVPAPLEDSEAPRRSQRLSQSGVNKLRAELEQCRAELFTKTQGTVLTTNLI